MYAHPGKPDTEVIEHAVGCACVFVISEEKSKRPSRLAHVREIRSMGETRVVNKGDGAGVRAAVRADQRQRPLSVAKDEAMP
jgi:hypothetical protein